jgi:thiol-disulfide isomerase/thioredoxin
MLAARSLARPRSTPSMAAVAALLATSLAASACGGGIPANAKTTVVSLAGADCAECGESMVSSLGKAKGVYSVRFDKRKVEVTVVADPGFDALAAVQQARGAEPFEAKLGAGQGSYVAWKAPPPGADVVVANRDGADVPDLTTHFAKGKVHVVDFSAPWCGPCRALDEHLVEVAAARPDVRYVKLDIGDWDSPLAARYLRGVAALPYVLVYDKAGKRLEAVSGLDLARVDRAIDQAGSKAPAAPAVAPPATPAEGGSK